MVDNRFQTYSPLGSAAKDKSIQNVAAVSLQAVCGEIVELPLCSEFVQLQIL